MRRAPVSSDKRHKPKTTEIPLLSAPDRGPQERWQHDMMQLQCMDTRGTLAARVVTECTLDVLQQRGAVSDKMWHAGLRLRRDYVGARVEARVVTSEISSSRISSSTRARRALSR